MNFNLFARSIHPELLEVCASRTFERDLYKLKLSITRDGHLVSFLHDDCLLTEISASAFHPLPTQGNLISHAIEKANHNLSKLRNINYQSTVEMEAVNPQIFVTIQQQLDARMECEGLVHRFDSNGRTAIGAISYMHVQSFFNHVLIRSFHTFPDTCAVMKSESRFSVT